MTVILAEDRRSADAMAPRLVKPAQRARCVRRRRPETRCLPSLHRVGGLVDCDDRETRALEQEHQLGVEIHPHRERMHFARHVDAVHPFVSADLQGERLVERVERDCADTKLAFAPIGGRSTLTGRRPRFGQPGAALFGPRGPAATVRVGHLVVEQQRATRLHGRVQAAQRLSVLLAAAPEPEHSAHDDCAVSAKRFELVQCLHPDVGIEPLPPAALAATGPAMSGDTSHPSTA